MSQRCSAKNRNGKRCGAWAVRGEAQCVLHSDPERAAELGSKHGRKVTLLCLPELLNPPHRPLKSAEEVCELLEETINRVRQGSLGLRDAHTIGFLSGVHLKALAQRVEVPEGRDEPNIYMSLFQRLDSAAPEQEIHDLFPQPKQQDETSISAPIPAPGESIDDPPTSRESQAQAVITVEVG
jgi:hypothetical protein